MLEYRCTFALILSAALAASAAAADLVPVEGTGVKYPRTTTVTVGGQPTNLKLTGVALRTKLIFNVYTIASYVQDGAVARTGEELTKLEAPRMLHLVMERTVSSSDFIGAFKTAIAKNYPANAFAAEFAQLTAAVGGKSAEKGEHVTLLYTPGSGVRIQIPGKVDVTIGDAAFAQAIWEVYLGPKPVDDGLKKGLTSLIKR
jgi:hypothetical protein